MPSRKDIKKNPELLKIIAKKEDYSVKPLLPDYSKAIIVTDTNSGKFFIANNKHDFGIIPTNPRFAEQMVEDKDLIKKILKSKGFHVIRGKQFYIKEPETFLFKKKFPIKKEDSVEASIDYAEKIKFPVFVKPNTGSLGRNARIIFSKSALKNHIKIMKDHKVEVRSFLIEKFTNKHEYRIVIVGGKIMYFYARQRQSIIGDGKKTVKELIDLKRYKVTDDVLRNILKLNNIKKSTVLKEGKVIAIQETANISAGAQIVHYVDSNISEAMQAWAKKLANATGLHFFGVDVFARNGGIDNPEDFLIIEINSNPGLGTVYKLGHKETVNKIFKKILRKYFGKPKKTTPIK